MNDELFKKLQIAYSKFRDAEKFVVPEIKVNYTDKDVKEMDKAFTDYYHEVEDIRFIIGDVLDELQKLYYD